MNRQWTSRQLCGSGECHGYYLRLGCCAVDPAQRRYRAVRNDVLCQRAMETACVSMCVEARARVQHRSQAQSPAKRAHKHRYTGGSSMVRTHRACTPHASVVRKSPRTEDEGEPHDVFGRRDPPPLRKERVDVAYTCAHQGGAIITLQQPHRWQRTHGHASKQVPMVYMSSQS